MSEAVVDEVLSDEPEIVDTNESGQDADAGGQIDLEQSKALLQERRQALSKDPRNVVLLNELGQTAEAAGDLDRARWAYKRAIRLNPSYAQPYRNLGMLYKKEGRSRPAVEALQNYFRYAEDDADLEQVTQALQSLLGHDDQEISQLRDETQASKQLAKEWEQLDITPGEAILLLDPDNSSGRDMMRFTLLDMIMRGVLEMDDRYGVGRGEHYGEIKLRPHEAMFAKYFARFRDSIDLDRLAQSAAQEIDSKYDRYKIDYVRQALEQRGYIQKETHRAGGLIPVQRYVLTDKGIRTRNQVDRLLKEVGVQLDRSMKTNPQKARAYVEDGGPAILLMESHPSTYFQEWMETLKQMGLGPTIQRARARLRGSTSGELVDELLKSILGE